MTGEPIIIRNDNLVPKTASAITIAPYVFMRENDSDLPEGNFIATKKHEEIHMIQNYLYLVGGELGFAGTYVGDYLLNRTLGMDSNQSYYNIFFEQQAFKYQEKFMKKDALRVNFTENINRKMKIFGIIQRKKAQELR